MVLDTFVAWQTAKLQAASCQKDFCLLCTEPPAEASCSMSGKTNHVGVTTMEKLHSGVLKEASRDRHVSAGILTPGRQSTKELSIQLINLSYSKPLHILILASDFKMFSFFFTLCWKVKKPNFCHRWNWRLSFKIPSANTALLATSLLSPLVFSFLCVLVEAPIYSISLQER